MGKKCGDLFFVVCVCCGWLWCGNGIVLDFLYLRGVINIGFIGCVFDVKKVFVGVFFMLLNVKD